MCRELLGHELTEFAYGHRCGCHVGDEPRLAVGVRLRDYCITPCLRMLLKHDFDRTEFDSGSADFYLMIPPPEKFQASVLEQLPKITAPVETSVGGFRPAVGDEFLGCQLRLIEISACHSCTADADFTRFAFGGRCAILIE